MLDLPQARYIRVAEGIKHSAIGVGKGDSTLYHSRYFLQVKCAILDRDITR